ncbi:hypothetical protein BU17DRAFT_89571 [Hysterangium stoloniferum]|nr:hypothetical protein BU17DRAFT_89571 [Hysterangium stoloniferum]
MVENVPKSSTSAHSSSHRRVARKERGHCIDAGDTLQDSRQLARLLAHDQVEATEMRRALVKVTDQLEEERKRTADAEARALAAETHVVELRTAKQVLLAEVQRDRETLKTYQIQVEVARKEITHAQQEINRLAAEKYRAEEEAARERSKSRQIQKEFEIGLAIERGRRQGYLDGREEGWRQAGYSMGGGRGEDEYYNGDEVDVEGEPPLSPRHTSSGQRPRTDYLDPTRSATNPTAPPDDYSEQNTSQLSEQQGGYRRYSDLGRSAMSPIRENASVRSRASNATQMRNTSSPVPTQGGTAGLELSMQMPVPQTYPAPSDRAPSDRAPSVRASSARAASARAPSIQASPARPPHVHSPPASIRAASVGHSAHHQAISSPAPLPDGQIFRQLTPQQSPYMPLMGENKPLPPMDPQLPTPITTGVLSPEGRGGLSPRPPSLVVQAATPPEALNPFSGTPYRVQDPLAVGQPEIEPVNEYLSPRHGSVRSLAPQP